MHKCSIVFYSATDDINDTKNFAVFSDEDSMKKDLDLFKKDFPLGSFIDLDFYVSDKADFETLDHLLDFYFTNV